MSKLKFFLIALVIGISAFTHLYRIDKTYIFNNDEGRDALITYRMIDTRQPVLLGPETSVGNMYLGPFYYYMMVPALMISGLDPAGPAVMVGLLGIVTTALLIYLGKQQGNLWAGLIAGLFYALTPIMVFASRSSWNPNVIPFFITLLLIIYPRKKSWYSLFFGIITGIIFQLHYVALVIPALLILRDIYLNSKSRSWKHLFTHLSLITVGFIIASSPFWLFEVRHNFINMHAFTTYLVTKSGGQNFGFPPYYMRLFTNFKLLILGLIGSSSVIFGSVSWLTWSSAAITLFLYVIGVRGLLTYLTLSSILIVSVLKENIFIHYISFLYPIISLMIGKAVTGKKIIKLSAVILIISLVIPTFYSLRYNLVQNTSSQPRRAHETADYIVREAGGRPYNVVNSSTSSTSTILYYLAISKNPPKNEDQPLVFVICEKEICSKDVLTKTDLFLNGPSHPTLIDYLGYTPKLTAESERTMLKNEWVTYDVYVATIELKP